MAKRTKRKPPGKRSGLTGKQALFIQEYLVDLNATQAAKRAGYSEKTAAFTGAQNLRKPLIAQHLQRALDARAKRVEVQADDILRELLRIATVDLRQAFDESGQLKSIHDMPEDVSRAISGLEAEELFEGRGEDKERVGRIHKVKFWDKPRALEMLGKHLAMWIDRREVSGPEGGPVQTQSVPLTPEELREELRRRGLPEKVLDE